MFAAMTFTLAACATATSPSGEEAEAEKEKFDYTYAEDERRGEEVNRICFNNSISGFRQATKRSVILERGRREFLVTTFARCQDLDYAISVATKTRIGSCLTRGDDLIAFDSLSPSRNNLNFPCKIDRIYEWNEEAAKEETEAEEPADEAVEAEAIVAEEA